MNFRGRISRPAVEITLRVVGQGDHVGDEWYICADREGTTGYSKDATKSSSVVNINWCLQVGQSECLLFPLRFVSWLTDCSFLLANLYISTVCALVRTRRDMTLEYQ